MNETAKLEIKQLGPHNSPERADRDARLISVLGHTALYEAYYSQDDSYNAARYITETYAPGRLAAELLDPAITYFVIYQDEKAVGFAKFRSGGTHESVTSRNAVELSITRAPKASTLCGSVSGKKIYAPAAFTKSTVSVASAP